MAYGGLNQPLCNITFFQQENVIVWKKLKQNRIEENLPIDLHGQYTGQKTAYCCICSFCVTCKKGLKSYSSAGVDSSTFCVF
jgi:hypothetical protein